jgi:hypothetical protein
MNEKTLNVVCSTHVIQNTFGQITLTRAFNFGHHLRPQVDSSGRLASAMQKGEYCAKRAS